MAIALGLAVALAYGTADFLARFSTRSLGVLGALFGTLLAGSLTLTLCLAFVDPDWGRMQRALPWLVSSGLLTAVMLGLLFVALERGPLSVASPIVATHPALVLLLLFVVGVRPGPTEWVGFALTLAGALLLSTQVGSVEKAQQLPAGHAHKTAIFAGLCAVTLSLQILSLQEAARGAGPFLATWGSRVVALIALLFALPFARRVARGNKRGWALTLVQGVLDVAAVLALTAGTASAERAIVPVVGSAFSLVTVLLARVFLKESMTGLQWTAFGVILAGVCVLGSA